MVAEHEENIHSHEKVHFQAGEPPRMREKIIKGVLTMFSRQPIFFVRDVEEVGSKPSCPTHHHYEKWKSKTKYGAAQQE